MTHSIILDPHKVLYGKCSCGYKCFSKYDYEDHLFEKTEFDPNKVYCKACGRREMDGYHMTLNVLCDECGGPICSEKWPVNEGNSPLGYICWTEPGNERWRHHGDCSIYFKRTIRQLREEIEKLHKTIEDKENNLKTS
jgi:hypothetical protein